MTLPVRSSGRTEVGKIRKHNEDAILVRDDLGLWVVADGLGGHAAGDYASGLIVDRLGAIERRGDSVAFLEAIEDVLADVNAQLLRVAAERGVDIIGSTVVMLVFGEALMFCGWVGDSRGYCYRNGRLIQMTTDHVHGIKDDVTHFGGAPSPAPGAGVLSRAVGAEERLLVDWVVAERHPGSEFLLCSDGINKELSDEELHLEFQRPGTPESHVNHLVDAALDRAGRDNISAVSILIES